MAIHNDLGNYGEDLAVDFLKSKGYRIEKTNWRHSKAEIDIIAWHQKTLVFVEVKTRSTDTFGNPSDFITQKKIDILAQAASVFMEKIGHDWEIRFDVISILNKPNRQPKIEHIEDAFFPGLK